MTVDVRTGELLPEPAGGVVRWAGVLGYARQLAEVLSRTAFVPKAMVGNADMITAAIMYGDEIGLPPMQALASINVINGVPEPSAELLRALIFRGGHSFAVVHADAELCRVSGLRAGRPEAERMTVEFSMGDARRAGLPAKNPNYQARPREMLLARATTALARALFPDVTRGLGYVGEAGDVTITTGTDEAEPAARPTVQLKRPRTRALPRLPKTPPVLATEDDPAPDGSYDVPLPEAPDDEADAGTMPRADAGPAYGPTHAPAPVGPDDTTLPEAPPEPSGSVPWRPNGPPPWDREPPVAPPAEDERHAARRRRMFAAYNALGIPDGEERETRLAFLSAVLGRTLTSTDNLTRTEVYTVTGVCADIQSGAVSYQVDENGVFYLTRHRDDT